MTDAPSPGSRGSDPTPPPDAVVTDPPDEATPPPPPPGGATDTASFPPPPPGATPAGAVPPPSPAVGEPAAVRPERPGLVGILVAVGVGLLAAAIVLSVVRSRADGELDWSNYDVGLGATAALLAIALVASFARFRGRGRDELVAWPGAVGILGAGAMVTVGLEEQAWAEDWLPYLVGGVIAGLAVLGYLAVRRGAFVVTAILGLALLYAQGFDDLFGDQVEDGDSAIWIAGAVTVFVLVVTALGWLLPTRALSGVVVGVGAVVVFCGIFAVMALTRALPFFFTGFGMEPVPGDPFAGAGGRTPDLDNDVWVVWALAGALVLLWAVAAAITGHPGFTVAAIAMPVATVPLGTFVLAVEHPTWWGAALAGAGGALLVIGVALQLLLRRRAERRGDLA